MRNSMRWSAGHAGIALGHAALHLDRAAHRIDDAGELHQQAVAGGLDDAAAVFGDLRIDQLAPMALEAREGRALVAAHQPRITRHIGREDRRQSSLVTRRPEIPGRSLVRSLAVRQLTANASVNG